MAGAASSSGHGRVLRGSTAGCARRLCAAHVPDGCDVDGPASRRRPCHGRRRSRSERDVGGRSRREGRVWPIHSLAALREAGDALLIHDDAEAGGVRVHANRAVGVGQTSGEVFAQHHWADEAIRHHGLPGQRRGAVELPCSQGDFRRQPDGSSRLDSSRLPTSTIFTKCELRKRERSRASRTKRSSTSSFRIHSGRSTLIATRSRPAASAPSSLPAPSTHLTPPPIHSV